LASSTRPTFSKRQREADQRDRVTERATRRADRKARAADRTAAGNVGPPMGEPIASLADHMSSSPRHDASAEDERRARWPPALDVSTPSSPQDTIMGNRLYVGNLSYSTDAAALRALFGTKGEVSDVHVVMDRDSGRPRGFAFVTMGSSAEAQKAISDLNGATLDDRQLRVNEAEERQDRGGGGGGGGRGGGGGGRGRY
jgi:cold-inducible RNA-binding protein